jgi:YVTN family beta-propeller protein
MRYGVLGPLEVRDGSRTIVLPRGRQRLLLAVLLLHANETLSSDQLIDALWGESPPPSAAASLHNLVSGLRKTLGNGQVVTTGHGYALRVADGELDVRRFDQLVRRAEVAVAERDADRAAALLGEALGLWRGRPLADLAYEPAVREQVERLEERRLCAIEERIEADLARGRHAQVLPELDALIAQHPLRERLRGQQMVALYRSGRQADALAAYRDARRALVAELGIEPGPALRGLERAVLEQDPALGGDQALPRLPRPPAPRGRAPRRPGRMALAGALLLAIAVGAVALASRSDPEPTGPAAVTGDLLVAIDPASNRIVEQATVGRTPTSVTVGRGAVWTLNANDRTVSRVDLETKTVRTFSGEIAPVDVAADEDGLWVAQAAPTSTTAAATDEYVSPGSVARVDPASGVAHATTTLPLPREAVRRVPPGELIAVGGGAVWTITRPGWVHRLDLTSGRLTTQRAVQAWAIAAGEDQVWVRDAEGRVVRLDPDTGRPGMRIPLAAEWVDALAVGEDAVWATDTGGGTVWRIDPERRAARTVDVGQGVEGIAVGAGAVWAVNPIRGTVSRIDPATNRVTATIAVPGTPRGVAVGEGRVWVSVAGTGQAAPVAGGLRESARVKALPAPPCGRVATDSSGDPDVLIASDLPLDRESRTPPMSQAIAFVLRERGFRAGRFTVGLQSCNDANAETGEADDVICAQNARAYARNPDVVGIVGPWNSGCARVMLPILNRAPNGPLALVSPTNSFPELVRRDPSEPADEDLLAELYPKGQRGYARVFPSDDYLYAAGAMLAHRLGDGRVFFLADRYTAEGPGWLWFRRAARRIGLEVAGRARWHERRRSYRDIAERVRASGVRAVYIDAYVAANTGQMLRDLRATLDPDVQIIGNPGFLPVAQLFENTGPAARGVLLTIPGLTTDKLGTSGERFVRSFGATRPGGPVSTYAIYAAAATEVLLDAIARSDGTRPSVARALSQTRLPDSVLGPLELNWTGEPLTHPITVVRAERGVARPDRQLETEGSRFVEIITPEPRLVGPQPSQ